MRTWNGAALPLTVALALTLGACKETTVTFLDCGCCETEDLQAPPETVGPEQAGETGEGDALPPPPQPKVGQPCAENTECELGLCITTKFLNDMGVANPDIVIPGGMCSKMFCTDDESCGPGAVCFNTKPFSGTDLGLCLVTCEVLASCRWTEGYSCYRAPLSPDDEEAGTVQACLPDSLVVAIECDDGHCEGQEPSEGSCAGLADCRWQEGISCYYATPDSEKGICIPDATVVAVECEQAKCPPPPAAE